MGTHEATCPKRAKAGIRVACGGVLLALIAVVGLSCSDDESGPSGCGAETCPDGCCADGQCVTPSPTSCGTRGATCQDCTTDGTTDSCEAGRCVCGATGTRCSPGTYCTSNGCGDCPPECGGKCAGADDGCGGVCVNDDCPDGCCDAEGICFAGAEQTSSACGPAGTECLDCAADPLTDSCDQAACVCAATGAPCPTGTYCTSSGCGACQPQCADKCAGADDGCGGQCVNSDCPDGCCSDAADCIPYTSQGADECGAGGERCADCAAYGYTCDDSLHTCMSTQANAARFVTQVVPLSMTPGEVVDVAVTMRNIGTTTWTDGDGYRLGAHNPQDNSNWGMARVDLEASDAIAPGESKTFSFQVTAPGSARLANFQWRMLQESVEWFGEFSDYAPVAVGTPTVTVCEAARSLAGSQTDATAAIQGCIDAAASRDVVELPAGAYRIDAQLTISSSPIWLRTEGTDPTTPPCAVDNHACAELSASTSFADTGGILRLSAAGTVVDHIVLNGNKSTRAATTSGTECGAMNNQYGHNMRISASDCALLSSVSKNALCGTGLEVEGVRDRIVVWQSAIVDNGVHDQQGMWADGVTIHDARYSTVANNTFVDNTDVDLIFGGCERCLILDNTIRHSGSFSGSSFAALMIHAWPTTSGNFNEAHTTGNVIDCGASRHCGFGLLLGSDAWYVTNVYGGHAYRNPVSNAQIGVALDDIHDAAVFDNRVENPATTTDTSCGTRAAHAYTTGSGTYNIDTTRETMGSTYTNTDYDGCIPNWWQ
ncbi:MAG: hypothetical protein JRI23_31410 [Deltaproteobacteria bacterium]|jgi:hypothetical protein|nr:hypothetical protein [Deltaproteobacteria bacterium]MBW2536718.1 hypothetical protein [Deltaproteobacteria bacterium]